MQGHDTETHIKRFLKKNPGGHLHVVVGYASVWGLAWLQDHTRGRSVTLIIGDTKQQHFANATGADRTRALALLERPDVQVLNWYRTAKSAQGKSMLHAKAWVVEDRSVKRATAALLGSANLTKVGLQDNWEMMAVAARSELPRLWEQLDGLVRGRTVSKKPWDAKSRLVETIESANQTSVRPTHRPAPRTPRPRTPAPKPRTPAPKPRTPANKQKSGCLVLAATVGAVTAALITVMLLLLA